MAFMKLTKVRRGTMNYPGVPVDDHEDDETVWKKYLPKKGRPGFLIDLTERQILAINVSYPCLKEIGALTEDMQMVYEKLPWRPISLNAIERAEKAIKERNGEDGTIDILQHTDAYKKTEIRLRKDGKKPKTSFRRKFRIPAEWLPGMIELLRRAGLLSRGTTGTTMVRMSLELEQIPLTDILSEIK